MAVRIAECPGEGPPRLLLFAAGLAEHRNRRRMRTWEQDWPSRALAETLTWTDSSGCLAKEEGPGARFAGACQRSTNCAR
eukprot:5634118-Pyramimonas_sp.AAC.1